MSLLNRRDHQRHVSYRINDVNLRIKGKDRDIVGYRHKSQKKSKGRIYITNKQNKNKAQQNKHT